MRNACCASEQALEARIRDGSYEEGSRLPTVRELAEQMRVNKNTVVRAYQALERKGYLELTRGRGAFVRQREPLLGTVDSRWLARLDQLLDDARGHALSRDALMHEITRSVDRLYGSPGLKVAFVECNAPDIEEMATVDLLRIERVFAQVSVGVGHRGPLRWSAPCRWR